MDHKRKHKKKHKKKHNMDHKKTQNGAQKKPFFAEAKIVFFVVNVIGVDFPFFEN